MSKTPTILTFFFFLSISFLILNEQMKRLGVTPFVSILSSLVFLSLITVSILRFLPESPNKEHPIQFNKRFYIPLLLLLGYFALISFPLLSGQVAFERSVDSDLYHHQATKSIVSITDTYQLNEEVVSYYSPVFHRVGESLSALFTLIFPFLTFLQAQYVCFLFLMFFTFYRLSKLWPSSYVAIFLVTILSAPTIFLQLHTNYVDLLLVPLFLIGLSYLILSTTRFEFLLATMWLALVGGLKLPLFLVMALLLLFFYIHKKIHFDLKFILLTGLIFSLPLAPLLLANLWTTGTPVAPYSILFCEGWDVMEMNFLPNRPPAFRAEGLLEHSAWARFVYSHFLCAFDFRQGYDSRLGGGGMMFPATIVIYVSFLIYKSRRCKKEIEFRLKHVCDFPFLILPLIILALVIIPETYWFRYVIIVFVSMLFYIFWETRELKNQKLQKRLMTFFVIISVSQFLLVRARHVTAHDLPLNPIHFVNVPHFTSVPLNQKMKLLKKALKKSDNILMFFPDGPIYDNLTGIYASAMPPLSKLEYRKFDRTRDYDIEELIKKYDAIIFVDTDLKKLATRYKGKGICFSDGLFTSLTFIRSEFQG